MEIDNASTVKKAAKVGLNQVQTGLVALGTWAHVIDFPVPPNSGMRKTGSRGIRKYYEGGIRTYLPIAVAALREGIDLYSDVRVLDFGCGVGRQLLHFTRRFPAPSYSACDIDETSIAFINKAYPQVDAYTSRFDPPLKWDDSSFDLTYSVSIFSHLSVDDHPLWLRELARVTRPGGCCMLTTEGLDSIRDLSMTIARPEEELRRQLVDEGFVYEEYSNWQDDVAKQHTLPIASVLNGVERSYGATILDPDHIRAEWPKYGFEIVDVLRGVIDHRQDLVIARRV